MRYVHTRPAHAIVIAPEQEEFSEVDMSDSSRPSRDGGPVDTWIPTAVAEIRTEIFRFGRTFVAFLLRPRHSAANWAAGTLTLMNPLGFVATAAGLYWAVVNGFAALWPVAGASEGIGNQLSSAIGPQIHYGLLGVTLHMALRVLGSHRRVAGSLAVSFFIGGSTGLLIATFMGGVTQYVAHARGTAALHIVRGDIVPLGLLIAAIISYGVVLLALSRAMFGLHNVSTWKMVSAGAIAVVLTALLLGSVLPEGSYGWHPYLAASLRSASFAFGFRG